jgi:hypothetical protein
MRRVLWIVTVMICFNLWANAQATTIADMARKERAKRESEQKPTPSKKNVTITNSRLKPKSSVIEVTDTDQWKNQATTVAAKPPADPVAEPAAVAPAPPPPTVPAVSAPSTPKPVSNPTATKPAAPTPPAPATAQSTEPVRDEKWWRERFEKTRTEVRRAENQVAVAELEFNAANRDFLTTSYDPDGRGQAAIAAKKRKMEDANTRLAETRAKVVQLEEELRQAGAPAGWAR